MRKRLVVVLPVVLCTGLLVLVARFGPYLEVVGALLPDQPHARGHDDLVVRVEDSPGTGSRESFFSDPPLLVVTGDGTAYVSRDAAPTGLVRPVLTLDLGEGGVQDLLKRASHDGLLADHPTYPMPHVMDGGETTVTLATGHGRWTHRAYALGPGLGFSARARLADFVGRAEALASSSSAAPYDPPALRVMAEASPAWPIDAAAWPAGATVAPADLGDCTVVRDPRLVRLLTTSADRFYRQDGTTYAVAAAVLLPGDSCGAAPGS